MLRGGRSDGPPADWSPRLSFQEEMARTLRDLEQQAVISVLD